MGAGFVTGDDGGGNQIGVAPGADWIAVKACTAGGNCSDANLLAALDWMLAPTDLTGANPDPSKAPDVVLGMWGGAGCDTFFQPSLLTLRVVNILSVLALGGSGQTCGTIGSPAALPEAIAAGATDDQDVIASFSARGPGCYGIIKPDLSAPGVQVRTSDNGNGSVIVSGTSWSTAHVVGAAAMLHSANPALSVDGVAEILTSTASCLGNPSCGGEPCLGANNVYGHGRIDVFEAVLMALDEPPYTDLPSLGKAPITGTLPGGESVGVEVTFDAGGLQPGVFTGGLVVLSSALVNDLVFIPVTLTVTGACAPITDLSISFTPIPPFIGEVITFTASAIGTPPIHYRWDFGDGSSGAGQEVTPYTRNQGVYTISLTADNGCGAPVMTWYGFMLYQRFWLPLALK